MVTGYRPAIRSWGPAGVESGVRWLPARKGVLRRLAAVATCHAASPRRALPNVHVNPGGRRAPTGHLHGCHRTYRPTARRASWAGPRPRPFVRRSPQVGDSRRLQPWVVLRCVATTSTLPRKGLEKRPSVHARSSSRTPARFRSGSRCRCGGFGLENALAGASAKAPLGSLRLPTNCRFSQTTLSFDRFWPV